VGAGGNAVEPKQLVEDAEIKGGGQIALAQAPGQADDQGAFQQGGVYGKAERGAQDKKKATPRTWSAMSA
jgi:hypothetical protein